MSGMTIGGMLEADQRLRIYEVMMRKRKREARDAELLRQYELEYEEIADAEERREKNGKI
jgi:hypothetical protein